MKSEIGEARMNDLRGGLDAMSRQVESMIADAFSSLSLRDSRLAGEVIRRDAEVDQLETRNDALCQQLLAEPLRPAEVRFTATALKIITDLERTGDMAVHIARSALELNELPSLKPSVDIHRAAEAARWMLRQALEALDRQDAEAAREVIDEDDTIDAYYHQMADELVAYAARYPQNLRRVLQLQGVAKDIERIGDHATNIAAMVVLLVQGEDLRHAAKTAPREE